MSRHRDRTLFGPLVLMAVLGVLAAGWTWTRPADPALRPAPGEAGIRVYLLDNGFHTDLAVPRAALAAVPGPLADAAAALGPGDWVLIGWGDARFYVDQRPIGERVPDGLRAFFWPGNRSVVMLDPEPDDPSRRFPGKGHAGVVLSRSGFAGMMRRVEASLDLDQGRARVAAARPGDDARFFASREIFSIAYLCNHWSARVLNAGGLAVRPLRSVTSAEVMATVRSAELDMAGLRD
ncbi:DUF2459 domain-containing protein [Rhizobium sp. CRIBSB]|nr:DUF2459 domain-containing protein [Rhizobium sp. CRIBSB]